MRHNMSIKCINFTFILLLLGTLSGCSVFDGNSVNSVNSVDSVDSEERLKTTELNYDEINQYVKEWEDAKPKVERLSLLEHDLALIIEEVGKLSKLNNLPPEYADQQVTDIIEAEYDNFDTVDSIANTVHSPSQSNGATNVDARRQVYAAHLAFFLKEDSAQVGWNVLKKRYPEILNNLTPVVKEVIRNQQTIFSLRVGPFDKEVGAKVVCYILSHYKYKCEPTDYSGNTISI